MAPSVSKKSSSPEYAYYDKLAEMKQKMPVAWFYIVGSVIIWTVVFWLLYRGSIYGAMYMRMDDSDLDAFCDEDFSEEPSENFNRLLDVPKGDAWPYLPALGITAKKQRLPKGKPSAAIVPPNATKFPPIVTAVTSDDFLAVQGLVQQIKSEIRPMFESKADVKFIVYELSMTTSEREVLSRHCDCLVRSVDVKKFPAHVFQWDKYSWKAVLIQLVLKEFGSALWVNPSARLNPEQLRPAVKMASEKGYLLWPEIPMVSVIGYTNPPTFQFYKEERCTFKDTVMVESDAMLFYATDFTLRGIMTPWLKCVLTESCVAPPHSTPRDCLVDRTPRYTGCHRYDQSALSIIVNRLLIYSENIEKLVPKFRVAKKAEKYMEYFPERPWTRHHRDYIIYGVVLSVISVFLVSLFGPLYLECMGVRFNMRKMGSSV